LHTRRGVG
jgi:CheY-like chemotaxis protein